MKADCKNYKESKDHKGCTTHRTALLLLCLLIALSAAFTAGCTGTEKTAESTITVTQTNGEPFSLDKPAERIILLNSNAGEVLKIIGVNDKVVGASQTIINTTDVGSLFPNVVSTGKWNLPDVETLLALKPDLVIAYSSSKPGNADIIEKSGIPIVYIDCYKPDTIAGDIRALAALTNGDTAEAEKYIAYYEDAMKKIETRIAGRTADTRVFCEGYTDYSVQSKTSGMGILTQLCGGKNILEEDTDTSASNKIVSAEWLITKNPDVYVKVASSADMAENAESIYTKLVSRTGFDKISAVENGRVYLIDAALSYGPRVFAGALAFAKMLYPEEFSDVSITEVLEEYNKEFGFEFASTGVVYPDSL